MQQLTATARSQSRPPLALIGWLQDEEESARSCNVRRIASLDTSLRTLQEDGVSMGRSLPSQSTDTSHLLRRFSSSLLDDDHHSHLTLSSDAFQDILRSRRTSSGFRARLPNQQLHWSNAIDRAVACAVTAPNHRRTEPFTLKRMLAPSARTKALADLAGELKRREVMAQQQIDDEATIEAAAQRKRDKWNQIPAFVVALCRQSQPVSLPMDPHQVLDFSPPASERDLEDYAASCAAVQNLLLSLHAEQVATKWATGPVVQTRAFRELVEADANDRVVGLIMIGEPKSSIKPRRHRRDIFGDVLVDL